MESRLLQLYNLTRSLSTETDHTKILEMTLKGAIEITRADGGSLYTCNGQKLAFHIMINRSLNIHLGGTSRNRIPFAPLELFFENQPNLHNVACAAVNKDQVFNIPDAYTETKFDFSGTKAFDKQTGYRSKSFLAIPLKDHENTIIGVLQLLNRISETGEPTEFNQQDQQLGEFLASQAAITLTNFNLIQAQKKLFESFIELIATAIDDKSPHTGGHCRRVPELTLMIADAANDSNSPEFKDFHMSESDRYELRLASLLHDCGKITTPVHVVEKATKLETIFDRIELVEARFEILKRDLVIESLKAGKANDAETKAKLEAFEKELQFLKRCNLGGEFMNPSDQSEVRRISQYTWTNSANQVVPLLNFEEVRNLTISRGTLNDDERQIINRHIDLSIEMLEKLPYPKNLSRIPEFAGGHHEKMDGRGYPRGLTRDQMSLQARIMGLADIFEALTAKDRPYKKGKTLSETLDILGKMKLNHHVDPDIFDLFIREKIYLRYAEIFMDPAQIDSVDESKIPGFEIFKTKGSSQSA